jgi:preprotein translocase subunit SecA
MLSLEIEEIIASHAAGDFADEWQRDSMYAQLTTILPHLDEARERLDAISNKADLSEVLQRLAEEAYEARKTELGASAMLAMQKLLLLRVIDSLWVEHLTAIDDMRRAIGLRAYSQRDPLNEFKIEAFGMFDELKGTIRHDITRALFHLTVVREGPSPLARAHEGRLTIDAGDEEPQKAAPVRKGPTPGRNEPCWCGSGKKYKRCHGA